MIARLARPTVVALFALVGALAPVTGADEEPGTPTPLQIMEDAFDRMFNYPSVRTVEFQIHRPGRIAYRRFHVAYEEIEGRGHTLVRFTEPPYLEESAMLMVDREEGPNDTWLYRPADRRVRRISTSQRADPFFGSDFTFEDLEHHDWTKFDLQRLPDAVEQGRPCYVIEASPQEVSQYRKMVARIEKERGLLLRLDFFRGGDAEPSKSLVVDPEEIDVDGEIAKPQRMWLRQNGREEATEVLFERIFTDVDIPDRLFKQVRGLGRPGRDLDDLVRRLEAGQE